MPGVTKPSRSKPINEKKFSIKKRNLRGMTAPPILMILVPLHENFDLYKVENLLIGSDDSAVVRTNSCGTTHIRFELVRF